MKIFSTDALKAQFKTTKTSIFDRLKGFGINEKKLQSKSYAQSSVTTSDMRQTGRGRNDPLLNHLDHIRLLESVRDGFYSRPTEAVVQESTSRLPSSQSSQVTQNILKMNPVNLEAQRDLKATVSNSDKKVPLKSYTNKTSEDSKSQKPLLPKPLDNSAKRRGRIFSNEEIDPFNLKENETPLQQIDTPKQPLFPPIPNILGINHAQPQGYLSSHGTKYDLNNDQYSSNESMLLTRSKDSTVLRLMIGMHKHLSISTALNANSRYHENFLKMDLEKFSSKWTKNSLPNFIESLFININSSKSIFGKQIPSNEDNRYYIYDKFRELCHSNFLFLTLQELEQREPTNYGVLPFGGFNSMYSNNAIRFFPYSVCSRDHILSLYFELGVLPNAPLVDSKNPLEKTLFEHLIHNDQADRENPFKPFKEQRWARLHSTLTYVSPLFSYDLASFNVAGRLNPIHGVLNQFKSWLKEDFQLSDPDQEHPELNDIRYHSLKRLQITLNGLLHWGVDPNADTTPWSEQLQQFAQDQGLFDTSVPGHSMLQELLASLRSVEQNKKTDFNQSVVHWRHLTHRLKMAYLERNMDTLLETLGQVLTELLALKADQKIALTQDVIPLGVLMNAICQIPLYNPDMPQDKSITKLQDQVAELFDFSKPDYGMQSEVQNTFLKCDGTQNEVITNPAKFPVFVKDKNLSPSGLITYSLNHDHDASPGQILFQDGFDYHAYENTMKHACVEKGEEFTGDDRQLMFSFKPKFRDEWLLGIGFRFYQINGGAENVKELIRQPEAQEVLKDIKSRLVPIPEV